VKYAEILEGRVLYTMPLKKGIFFGYVKTYKQKRVAKNCKLAKKKIPFPSNLTHSYCKETRRESLLNI